MSFILATRNPRTDKLTIMTEHEESNDPAEFNTETEAEVAAQMNRLFQAWGYTVVEVE